MEEILDKLPFITERLQQLHQVNGRVLYRGSNKDVERKIDSVIIITLDLNKRTERTHLATLDKLKISPWTEPFYTTQNGVLVRTDALPDQDRPKIPYEGALVTMGGNGYQLDDSEFKQVCTAGKVVYGYFSGKGIYGVELTADRDLALKSGGDCERYIVLTMDMIRDIVHRRGEQQFEKEQPPAVVAHISPSTSPTLKRTRKRDQVPPLGRSYCKNKRRKRH